MATEISPSVPLNDVQVMLLRLFSRQMNSSELQDVVFAEPYLRWRLIEADPDDNKFADLAISANANCLVSNDRHFRVLKNIPFPLVEVLTLEKFRVLISS